MITEQSFRQFWKHPVTHPMGYRRSLVPDLAWCMGSAAHTHKNQQIGGVQRVIMSDRVKCYMGHLGRGWQKALEEEEEHFAQKRPMHSALSTLIISVAVGPELTCETAKGWKKSRIRLNWWGLKQMVHQGLLVSLIHHGIFEQLHSYQTLLPFNYIPDRQRTSKTQFRKICVHCFHLATLWTNRWRYLVADNENEEENGLLIWPNNPYTHGRIE